MTSDISNVPKYPILDDIAVPDEVLENWQNTVDILAQLANIPAALIMRVHAHEIEVLVSSQSAGNVYRQGERAALDSGLYCETVMDTQMELLVSNALKDPDWEHNPDSRAGMVSFFGLPLTWSGHQVFGIICILDNQENAYTPLILDVVKKFRDSVQLSLNNLYETNQAHRQVIKTKTLLHECVEMFRVGVESLEDHAIYMLDSRGYVISWNSGAERIKGYSADEILDQHFSRFYHQEDIESGKPDWSLEIATTQGRFEEQCWLVRKDGSRFMANIIITPLFDNLGDLRGYAKVVRDNTERKKIEADLEDNRRFLSDLIENSGLLIFAKDREGRYLMVNSKWEQTTGLSRDQVIGYKDEILFPSSMGRRFYENDLEVMESGTTMEKEEIFGNSLGLRTFLSTKFPLLDNAGKVIGVCGITADISERKQAEIELQLHRHHLEGLVKVRTLELEQANLALEAEMSKLKKTEEKLDSFNRDFEAFLDQTSDFIYFKDINSRFRFCSKPLATITGHSDWRDMIGKHDREVFPPDTVKIYQEDTPVLSEGRPILNRIDSYYDDTGRQGYVMTNKWPLFDAEGQIVGIFGISRDITEYKQAEIALQEKNQAIALANIELKRSEHKFRAVAEGGSFGIVICDLTQKVLYQNPMFEQLFGYTPEEIPSVEYWWSLAYPDGQYRNEVLQRWNNAVEAANRNCTEIVPMEALVTCKDGSQKHIEFRMASTGEFDVVIFIDITARKQAEAEYKTILETSHDGFWIVSAQDSRLLDVNHAAVQMLGYSREELLKATIADIDAIQTSEQVVQKIQEIKSSIGSGKRFQTQHRCRDGGIIDVEISAQYLNVRGGICVVFVRDISESLAANQALKDAKLAAESASKAKSNFLANMSHELRTPLNAILGFSDLLHRDPATTESQKQTLGIIHKSGDHLLGLINDVLDIAKIEAGRMILESASFDLGSMILDIAEMLRIRARDKGLQLTIEQSSELPHYIVGDEVKLRQILINLISNAIKATERGRVTLRLGWNPEQSDYLLIEVEDTGCGIAPEDQGRLMQPFVQVNTVNQSGTGLGLAISRQFVELMGGTLTLNSTVGQGSTFLVNLPVQLASPEDVPEATKTWGEVIGLAPDQPSCQILVVEDQEENELLLMSLLENAGFEARLAKNGAEAVEIFTAWIPDFIFMDRRMPVMDGVEATRRIRALPGGKQVKIVAVTASTFREETEEMLEAGFDEIVYKPFRIEQIFDCMERLLGLRFLRSVESDAVPDNRTKINAASIAAVPEVLLADLHEALIVAESEGIQNAIDAIAQKNPQLADAINERVQNYNYEAVLLLLEARQT